MSAPLLTSPSRGEGLLCDKPGAAAASDRMRLLEVALVTELGGDLLSDARHVLGSEDRVTIDRKSVV